MLIRGAMMALLVAVMVVSGAGPILAGAEKSMAATAYVCPPCGDEHDRRVFEKPGSCPVCGMTLVEKREVRNVGILLFEGVQIIDYTGPYEVFGQAGMNVYTVSENGKTITTNMGMSVNPTYSFENSPEADILLIPGGSVQASYESAGVLDWIRAQSVTARHVLSVCNGAFILAKTGLLDGMSATTYYGLLEKFKEFAPRVKVVDDQRYVDNGKFITSAGLSSGIDASLYVVSKVKGMGRAEGVALNMEYDWRPDSGYARGAFADMSMPKLDFPDGVNLRTASASGDRDRWEAHYAVTGDLSAAEVLEFVNQGLAKLKNWQRSEARKGGGDGGDGWRFTDDDGDQWACETFLGPEPESGGGPTFAYRLRRVEKSVASTSKGAGK